MKRFSDIAMQDFPLNHEKYNDLMDQIRNAARGFSRLGTSESKAVDESLMQVWAGLQRTWNLIQDIERRERAN